jgi:predicted Zn-dependent protease
VALCTDNIDGAAGPISSNRDALYIHVISHEIGHLVRLNGHASNCSFSDALGFAAEYAFRGIPY